MRTEDFYRYIHERELIRIKKEDLRKPQPWTDDPILREYKFTNVKRINDFTTRKFAAEYALHRHAPELQALYNAGLYRYFGTVAWMEHIGWLKQHDSLRIVSEADIAQIGNIQIFTGAYVITNGGRAEPKQVVVAEYLQGLWDHGSEIIYALYDTRSWEAAFRRMNLLLGFGGTGFMAKEVLQDFLIWLDFKNDAYDRNPVDVFIKDYWTFSPLGPGARRGLNRVFGRAPEASLRGSQGADELGALRQAVSPLYRNDFAEELSAHDVQFCLCEFDKYERVRLGEGRPRSRYSPRGR